MAADHHSRAMSRSTTCAPSCATRRCRAGCCNTLVFATLSTVSIVATSALTGYVLGKFRFRGADAIFAIILATAIVPFEVYMIPLYLNVQGLGLLNSLGGPPHRLSRHELRHLPHSPVRLSLDSGRTLEAARVDGANEGWIFFRIVLPLMRGPLGALAVLAFFQAWTAFVWPLLVATTRTPTRSRSGLRCSSPASPSTSAA